MNEAVTAVPTTMADLPSPEVKMKYPWKAMEVGNHFVWPGTQNSAYTAARRMGRRLGKKFAVRTVGDQITIWRIK